MTADRKKPGVAFWATVGLVVVLVGYPLSFGPTCWLATPQTMPLGRLQKIAPRIYWPLGRILKDGPEPIAALINWYATLGTEQILLPTGADPMSLLYGASRSIRLD